MRMDWNASIAERLRRRVARALIRHRHRLSRFRDDESGGLIAFALVMFVCMLMVSGMAVDIMRHETMRVRLQNTLDAATLAAANMDQTLNPDAVVQDYFAKAGLTQYLTSVTSSSTLNSRMVNASARAEVPSLFMQLAGVRSLTAPAASTAREAIGNVEISLVLDVSGSMGQNHKIDHLKVAAKQFVDTMFDAVTPGKLSLSIVPYAAQVTAGPTLLNYYNSTKDHSYSYCLDFSSSDFTSSALTTTQSVQQAGHFDPWNQTTLNISNSNRVCPLESSRYIVPVSDDRAVLKAAIDAFQPGGNTSIDVGMKWGAALVDPSSQPIVSDMISKGTRPAGFTGRPYGYTDRESYKVIVVMTDGENTNRAVLKPPYLSGLSAVYKNSGDSSNFSFFDASQNKYFWTVDDQWHTAKYASGGGTYQKCTYSRWYGYSCTYATASGTATQMTWPQVWDKMSIDWFTSNIINPAYGSYAANNWSNNLVTWLDPYSTMDTQLHNICASVKANNVSVYSIGFETNNHGRSVLQDCATRPSYYYDVAGVDISTAFASIANSINRLRLTQ